MGYLRQDLVEVDAILTKRGRELLSRGAQYFNITQFALADDEIDYRLWNPNHSLGSNYYGEVIESMPILEAVPDERQMMKSKLVTLPKNVTRMPIISSGISGNPSMRSGQKITITPSTPNYSGGNAAFGYTCIVSDGDVFSLEVAVGGQLNYRDIPTSPVYLGDGTGTSVSAMGKSFVITARSQYRRDRTVTVTIIGNETGGRASFTATVLKDEVAIVDNMSTTFLMNTNNE